MHATEAEKYLEQVAAQLGEHFDAVQILVSWPAEGGIGTRFCKRGAGNWFARQGMAQGFIDSARAIDSAAEIAKAINPETQL